MQAQILPFDPRNSFSISLLGWPVPRVLRLTLQPFWDAGPQPLSQRSPELPKVGGLTCDHMEPQTFLSEPKDLSEGIYPWVLGKSAAESKRLRAEVTGPRLLGPLCLLLFIFSVSKLIPARASLIVHGSLSKILLQLQLLPCS